MFSPIENKYGDFRYNDELRKQVAKERNNIDFEFINNNVCKSYNIFKNCEPFKEKYPAWYKRNEIAHQMKIIVDFYSNSKCENVEYKYLTPQEIDNFVEKTFNLICCDLKNKGWFD